MEKTLRIINQLLEKDIIKRYAIGGGIACLFYVEPTMTYDLDVMVILSSEENPLTPLRPIYDWAKNENFELREEHIVIEGIPVQFLPVYNELIKEAVLNSVQVDFNGVDTFIFKAEYLVAIMLDTYRPKDKIRIIQIIEEVKLDRNLLDIITKKYNLAEKLKKLLKED